MGFVLPFNGSWIKLQREIWSFCVQATNNKTGIAEHLCVGNLCSIPPLPFCSAKLSRNLDSDNSCILLLIICWVTLCLLRQNLSRSWVFLSYRTAVICKLISGFIMCSCVIPKGYNFFIQLLRLSTLYPWNANPPFWLGIMVRDLLLQMLSS